MRGHFDGVTMVYFLSLSAAWSGRQMMMIPAVLSKWELTVPLLYSQHKSKSFLGWSCFSFQIGDTSSSLNFDGEAIPLRRLELDLSTAERYILIMFITRCATTLVIHGDDDPRFSTCI